MSSLITVNIYKIVSPNTDKIYIGSTTQTLHKRMQSHMSDYTQKRKSYSSSLIIAAGNATIELIEVFNCDTRKQLLQREGYYIRLYINICVNKIIPDRSPQEYKQDNQEKILTQRKQRYETHKDQILIKEKQYRESHKEQIATYRQTHKERIAAYRKKYRETHREQRKAYDEAHKEQINAQRKKRDQAKRQAKLQAAQTDALCQNCPGDSLAQQSQPLISQVESLDQ
jgi:hypothetical protein